MIFSNFEEHKSRNDALTNKLKKMHLAASLQTLNKSSSCVNNASVLDIVDSDEFSETLLLKKYLFYLINDKRLLLRQLKPGIVPYQEDLYSDALVYFQTLECNISDYIENLEIVCNLTTLLKPASVKNSVDLARKNSRKERDFNQFGSASTTKSSSSYGTVSENYFSTEVKRTSTIRINPVPEQRSTENT